MLNKTTVEIGVNLGELFADRNVKIIPKANTLINELSRSIDNNLGLLAGSPYIDVFAIKNDILDASNGSNVVVAGNQNAYTPSEHDTYMDNYIEDLAKLVSGHIDFSRNVVNKEVQKLVERVQENINSYKYREAEDFFNVVYYKLPDVLNVDVLASEIPSYANDTKSIRQGIDQINLRGLEDSENFVQFLTTGVDEEDAIIAGWFSSLGEAGKHYVVNRVEEFALDVPSAINYYLVNYLFYRALASKPDLINGESVATTTRKALNNRAYFGASLANAITNYKAVVRSGRLLASNDIIFSYFNTKQLDVVIYEESFAKLAEAGGNIETVFGYIASGSRSGSAATVADLTKGDVDYLDRWSKTRSLYLIHLNNQRLDIFKHLLRQAFEACVAETAITEAEKEFYQANSEFAKETLVKAYAYIDSIHAEDMEGIDAIALELVAKIRFRFSNAYDILSKMQCLMANDETLEPMEAALYAVVSYLTSYCMEQVDVVQFG